MNRAHIIGCPGLRNGGACAGHCGPERRSAPGETKMLTVAQFAKTTPYLATMTLTDAFAKGWDAGWRAGVLAAKDLIANQRARQEVYL